MADEWTNIEQSEYGKEILRYQADRKALDEITHSLGLLPQTLKTHINLKSDCLAVLILLFVEQIKPVIQLLPDESAFYLEPTHDLEQPPITRVNNTAYETHREECRERIGQLKAALSEAHYQIDTWCVQEFGKIRMVEVHPVHGTCDWSNTYNYLEDEIYQGYMKGYDALMQP